MTWTSFRSQRLVKSDVGIDEAIRTLMEEFKTEIAEKGSGICDPTWSVQRSGALESTKIDFCFGTHDPSISDAERGEAPTNLPLPL